MSNSDKNFYHFSLFFSFCFFLYIFLSLSSFSDSLFAVLNLLKLIIRRSHSKLYINFSPKVVQTSINSQHKFGSKLRHGLQLEYLSYPTALMAKAIMQLALMAGAILP